MDSKDAWPLTGDELLKGLSAIAKNIMELNSMTPDQAEILAKIADVILPYLPRRRTSPSVSL